MAKLKAEAKVRAWLRRALADVPARINLLSLEWNEGWASVADHDAGKPKAMVLSLFGCRHPRPDRFDPERPADLDRLADPPWGADDSLPLTLAGFRDIDLSDYFRKLLPAAKELKPVLAGRPLAYGGHEGSVQVYPPLKAAPAGKKAAGEFFYELDAKGASNFIESSDLNGFDETPLLEHDKVPARSLKGVVLRLQERAKLLDFLYFYRGWLVCSRRMADLFRAATRKVQVFPAPLVRPDGSGWKPVTGYFVVNVYEKLDCLPPADVLPPPYKGARPRFDPIRGYRVRRNVVGDRPVFRINYEYHRLVVSQAFRDRLEAIGATGVSWLRRPSVP
jgi:hypothetical protein